MTCLPYMRAVLHTMNDGLPVSTAIDQGFTAPLTGKVRVSERPFGNRV